MVFYQVGHSLGKALEITLKKERKRKKDWAEGETKLQFRQNVNFSHGVSGTRTPTEKSQVGAKRSDI